MKKLFLVFICCFSLSANAQLVKYCMTYADFVADNWTPIEALTEGRTNQACQIKFDDDMFKFKTGDKEADKIIKKEVLAIMYGDQLFVNCRNLRRNEVQLDSNDYAKAFRFNGDKICLLGYKINNAAFLASLGADVAGFLVNDRWVSAGLFAGSSAIWMDKDLWHKYVCYLLDSEANEKGRTEVVQITDEVMENLLADTPELFLKYMGVESKRKRQAASNVLPILMEKGLVDDGVDD